MEVDSNSALISHISAIMGAFMIFGVANAFDIENCMVVTSTDFTKDARNFAALKEDRISLVNGFQLTKLLNDYRWEYDE